MYVTVDVTLSDELFFLCNQPNHIPEIEMTSYEDYGWFDLPALGSVDGDVAKPNWAYRTGGRHRPKIT